MHLEKYAVLISIFPIYANQIFEGVKKVEFRKKIFNADIKKIVIYSTMPIGKIEGFVDYDGIETCSPSELWRKYSNIGGIKKERYDAYFSNLDIAYGIKVKNPVRFNRSFAIAEIGKKPPQSYAYLTKEEFAEICRKGGF